ncbi:hypothetical protein [Bradyrhizobium cenepequi]|uniref:hypothetical protein n=1 Tax=Bradyrhizobium cenepequi TaxID=2821403 RepID=UPI001CE381B9|nr:hypothetical protein [Bradyrhizobium cenepequi]MCA6112395.1 hypothetical protein [Bradyrhizobium cenepequi]
MFRVFAKNGVGGVSVILATAGAALRKLEEFRDDGFRTLSVHDASGTTISEGELTAMAQAERKGAL